jgi:hypothetical protein
MLLFIWMLFYGVLGFLHLLVPTFFGSFFVWSGTGTGWERETGLWNLGAAVLLGFVARTRSEETHREMLFLISILSVFFAINHAIALLASARYPAHWFFLVFHSGMAVIGLRYSAGARPTDQRRRRMEPIDPITPTQITTTEVPPIIEIKVRR